MHVTMNIRARQMPPTILIISKETQKKDGPIYLTAERESTCLSAIHSHCIFTNNTKLRS